MYKIAATFFIWLFFYGSSAFAQSTLLPPMRDVKTLPPIDISKDDKLASIKFSGLALNIPEGTTISTFYKGENCQLDRTIEYKKSLARNYRRLIFNANEKILKHLNDSDYNIVDGSSGVFNQAKYFIAGKIINMETNVCSPVEEDPLLNTGYVYYQVEWQIYDTNAKNIALTKTTEGYIAIESPKRMGISYARPDAMVKALDYLFAEPEFYNLVSLKPMKLIEQDPIFDDLKIEYTLVTDTSDPRPLDTLERSVIGIKTTSSTGSGFIISSSGYILTNNHVVDGYDKVSIVFSNGVEAEGTVIRSAPARDVALIKIPLNNLSQLSLNKQLPKVGSQAYAMGAPKGLEFQGTLSSGIISAIRNNANGHPLIQSDTNITFGNSGGPMFDSNGHVIGISVSISKIVDFANYFIPIESALATLNIQSN